MQDVVQERREQTAEPGACWEMAEHDREMDEAEGQRRTDDEMVMTMK